MGEARVWKERRKEVRSQEERTTSDLCLVARVKLGWRTEDEAGVCPASSSVLRILSEPSAEGTNLQ